MIFRLVLLIFIGLMTTIAKGEVTSPEEGFAEISEDHNQSCSEIEVDLQNDILESLETTRNRIESLVECTSNSITPSWQRQCQEIQNATNQVIETAVEHREQVSNFFNGLYLSWYRQLDPAGQHRARMCFHSDEQSIEPTAETAPVEPFLTANQFRINEVAPSALCRRFNLDNFIPYTYAGFNAYREASEYPEGGEEFQQLLRFRRSPLGKALGADFGIHAQQGREELTATLHSKLDQSLRQIDRLKRRIGQWGNSRRFNVYQFDSHFQAYLNQQPPEQRQNIQACRDSSTWARSCLGSSESVRSSTWGECAFRTGGVLADFLPVIGMIDSVIAYRDAQGAYAGNLVSAQEHQRQIQESSFNFLLSLPITGATTAATSGIRMGGVLGRGALANLRPDLSTGRLIFIRGNAQRAGDVIPNEQVALSRGQSYTVVQTREGELVIGENIPSLYDDTIGGAGSHVTLSDFANIEGYSYINPGAIRVNRNGSIDISGRANQGDSLQRANRIRALVEELFPGASLRVTPGRLSDFPPP